MTMQTPRPNVQPLDYQSPSRDPGRNQWIVICVISLVAAAVFIGIFVWGFGWSLSSTGTSITVTKPPLVIPAPGIASNLINAGDSETQAAVAAAVKTLDDLQAGKVNSANFGPAVHNFKEFQSWSITSITPQTQPPSRTLSVTLRSGDTTMNFNMQMIKQKDGTWRAGGISGTNSK